MQIVLVSNRSGQYYHGPDPNDNREPYFVTRLLSEAQIFTVMLSEGKLVTEPALPAKGSWTVKTVSIKLEE